MKTLKTVVLILWIMLTVWVLFSWIDILAHNNPSDGDYKYSPINMFILVERLYG